ncbi:hypothetical protein E2562_025979 [Oryza meyeriana var. granulata]|uniref:non-specific serine/threonine protein kinase n=1 Tax=Oryza meyeriana var. granulata TaxID=110450 RepID=A0A6G1EYV7_9ORYZ|nr:hypothetical protein E2562_025979 [Oryza meyeriana var. granulata]
MRVTTKCDVYSFGVVAMEMLMGKYPGGLISSLEHSDEGQGGGESESSRRLQLKDVVDQRLDAPAGQLAGQVVFAFVVALSCVRTSPDARPTMRAVAQELAARRRPILDRPFGMIKIGDLTKSHK